MSGDSFSMGNPVKQVIVAAPRLTDICTEDFVTFKEKRAVYERLVAERSVQTNAKFPLTTYRHSMDESVLRLFIIAKWIDATSLDEITEEQIKRCIDKRAVVAIEEYDPGLIEREIKNVSMDSPVGATNLERQVWRLCLKYIVILQRAGYKDFVAQRTKIAVRHMFMKISHGQLKNRMRMLLDLRKDELEADFNAFVRLMAEEARTLGGQESAMLYAEATACSDRDEDSQGSTRSGRTKVTSYRGEPTRMCKHVDKSAFANSEQGRTKKRRRSLPKCINPQCKDYHFLRDCPTSTEEEKQRYKKEYRQAKRRRRSGRSWKN